MSKKTITKAEFAELSKVMDPLEIFKLYNVINSDYETDELNTDSNLNKKSFLYFILLIGLYFAWFYLIQFLSFFAIAQLVNYFAIMSWQGESKNSTIQGLIFTLLSICAGYLFEFTKQVFYKSMFLKFTITVLAIFSIVSILYHLSTISTLINTEKFLMPFSGIFAHSFVIFGMIYFYKIKNQNFEN